HTMPARKQRADPPADQPLVVLVVEDEPANRLLLQTVVEDVLGGRAIVAANGVEALAAVEREMPDVILLDLMLPALDGFAVAARLVDDDHARAGSYCDSRRRPARIVMRNRPRRCAACGSGSVGRASPCQGEGRGFESRLPLPSLPAVARRGDVAKWLRRSSAKALSPVRFRPSPPLFPVL